MSSEVRQAVIEEARSWIGTRFHHRQAVKGRGVDCAMSLIEWFSAVGAIEHFVPPPYSASWFLHQEREVFLEILERYANRLDSEAVILPADVAMYKYGKCAAHGALIVDDTYVIHAYAVARRVTLTERATLLPNLHSYWRVRGL